jgi:hypothetical protein
MDPGEHRHLACPLIPGNEEQDELVCAAGTSQCDPLVRTLPGHDVGGPILEVHSPGNRKVLHGVWLGPGRGSQTVANRDRWTVDSKILR